MSIAKRAVFILLSIIILVGCDLQTKQIAKSELKGKLQQNYIAGTITLVYAENSGGMLSFGSELSDTIRFLIFRVFVGLVLVGMLIYTILVKNLVVYKLIAFVLILSGGFGNLIDRIFQDGVVIDFIVLKAFSLSTGIFNAADMFVMIGMFIILFGNLIYKYQNESVELE